jgi:hypothetical protein
MSKVPGPGTGRPDGFTAGAKLPVSTLFTILWDALADLLGTATLLKRAARRAAVRSPELAGLVIRREGLAYTYTCPAAWSGSYDGTPPALRDLIGELSAFPLNGASRSWSTP